MRDSLIFYRSFMESFAELPDEERLKMYDAIFKYGLDGEDPKLSGTLAALFRLVKPQLDANERRYQNGLKGGRKPNENQSETKANQTITKANQSVTKRNQTETKRKPNVTKHKPNVTKAEPNVNDNDNVNVNENGNGNENASGSDEDIPLSLISYLNQKTGSHYKADAGVTQKIIALFGQGYSVDDMRAVIDRKCAEWSGDEKMRSYLRPSTLFGEKFGEYLNAPEPIELERQKGAAAKQEQLLKDLSDKENELEQISERIDVIRNGGDESVKANFDELNELKLAQAITEQDIESLKRRTGAAT